MAYSWSIWWSTKFIKLLIFSPLRDVIGLSHINIDGPVSLYDPRAESTITLRQAAGCCDCHQRPAAQLIACSAARPSRWATDGLPWADGRTPSPAAPGVTRPTPGTRVKKKGVLGAENINWDLRVSQSWAHGQISSTWRHSWIDMSRMLLFFFRNGRAKTLSEQDVIFRNGRAKTLSELWSFTEWDHKYSCVCGNCSETSWVFVKSLSASVTSVKLRYLRSKLWSSPAPPQKWQASRNLSCCWRWEWRQSFLIFGWFKDGLKKNMPKKNRLTLSRKTYLLKKRSRKNISRGKYAKKYSLIFLVDLPLEISLVPIPWALPVEAPFFYHWEDEKNKHHQEIWALKSNVRNGKNRALGRKKPEKRWKNHRHHHWPVVIMMIMMIMGSFQHIPSICSSMGIFETSDWPKKKTSFVHPQLCQRRSEPPEPVPRTDSSRTRPRWNCKWSRWGRTLTRTDPWPGPTLDPDRPRPDRGTIKLTGRFHGDFINLTNHQTSAIGFTMTGAMLFRRWKKGVC